MELWKDIGLNKDISELPVINLTYKNSKDKFISRMMLFKNTLLYMANISQEINYLMENFKNILMVLIQKKITLSMIWFSQEWNKYALILLKVHLWN